MEQRKRYELAENDLNEELTLVQAMPTGKFVRHVFSNNINPEDSQQPGAEPRKNGLRTLLFLAEVLLGIFDTLNPGLGIRYLLS